MVFPEHFCDIIPLCECVSQAVYKSNPSGYISEKLSPKVDQYATFDDGQVLMVTSERLKLAVVGFRGTTEGLTGFDWTTNFKILPTATGVGTFHRGFYVRASTLKRVEHTLVKLASQGYDIVTTGHSLGGAAAIIAAHNLHVRGAEVGGYDTLLKTRCVAFAPPLVAVGERTRNRMRAEQFLSIVNEEDIVPKALTLVHDTAQGVNAGVEELLEKLLEKVGLKTFWQNYPKAVDGVSKGGIPVEAMGTFGAAAALAPSRGLAKLFAYVPVGYFTILRGTDLQRPAETYLAPHPNVNDILRFPTAAFAGPDWGMLPQEMVALHEMRAYEHRISALIKHPDAPDSPVPLRPLFEVPRAHVIVAHCESATESDSSLIRVEVVGNDSMFFVNRVRLKDQWYECTVVSSNMVEIRVPPDQLELHIRLDQRRSVHDMQLDTANLPKLRRGETQAVIHECRSVGVRWANLPQMQRNIGLSDLIKMCQTLSIFYHPRAGERLESIRDVLVDMVDTLPLECAFKAIANKDTNHSTFVLRMARLDSPQLFIASQATLEFLEAAANNMGETSDHIPENREETLEFLRRYEEGLEGQEEVESHADAMILEVTEWVVTSNSNFARVLPLLLAAGVLAVASGMFSGMASGMAAGATSATVTGTAWTAGVGLAAVAAVGSAYRALYDQNGSTSELKKKMHESAKELRASAPGCPEYCGSTLSVKVATKANPAVTEPFFLTRYHVLDWNQGLLVMHEAQARPTPEGSKARTKLMQRIQSTYEGSSLVVSLIDRFIGSGTLKFENQSTTKAVGGSVVKAAHYVGGTVWGLATAAWRFDVSSAKQDFWIANDNIDQRFRTDEQRFETYEEMVKLLCDPIDVHTKVSRDVSGSVFERERRIVEFLRADSGLTFESPVEDFVKPLIGKLWQTIRVEERHRFGFAIRLRLITQCHRIRHLMSDIPMVGVQGSVPTVGTTDDSGHQVVIRHLVDQDPTPTLLPTMYVHPFNPNMCVLEFKETMCDSLKSLWDSLLVRVKVVDHRSVTNNEGEPDPTTPPTITCFSHYEQLLGNAESGTWPTVLDNDHLARMLRPMWTPGDDEHLATYPRVRASFAADAATRFDSVRSNRNNPNGLYPVDDVGEFVRYHLGTKN
eukprot:GFYU01000186.1.p1 GENE.GFYU01000186.1~~GFYU01000186.1.p1  ORF type:complete len:1131 (+),score=155.90 GFYU01000186.1:39-3431(+)